MQKQYLQNWRKSILDKYKVKINPKAAGDIDHIYEYLPEDRLAPESAPKLINLVSYMHCMQPGFDHQLLQLNPNLALFGTNH